MHGVEDDAHTFSPTDAARLALKHMDSWSILILCGPLPSPTITGKEYYILFLDDYSTELKVALLAHKSDAMGEYLAYEAWVTNHRDAKIVKFHTDRGGEYTSNELKKHLEQQGTEHPMTVHDSPQQNGAAERRNRVIMERIRAMLFDSGLPVYLWGEALFHAVFLINRSPAAVLNDKTPHEVATGQCPDLSHLRRFGQDVWVRVDPENKLARRAILARWIGFASDSKGHRIYWGNRRVTVERDVKFIESAQDAVVLQQLYAPDLPEILPYVPPVQPATPAPAPAPTPADIPPAEEGTVRRSTRQRKESPYVQAIMRGDGTADGRKSKKLPPGVKALSKSGKGEDKDEMAVLCTEEDSGDVLLRDLHADATELQYALPVTDVKLPYTYAEAMASPEAAMWKEAMDAEMESHRKHGTWELVDRPEGVIIHPQKWVYDVKRHPDGSIRAPKARTVGQGYNQVPGRDFTETYVPMMRSESFRAILAALLPENYIFRQFDIKTAYLHAPLDQPLYVRQPVGYEVPGKVCMLLKGSLRYETIWEGLQRCRQWCPCGQDGIFVLVG